jgi:uncharacterized protein (TIGR03435 family)
MVCLRVLLVCFASVALVWAQAPSFEVASLKPSPPPEGDLYRANLGTVRHGELTMINVTLSDCLRFAYGITNDLQLAGPVWIKDKGVRFDILAKASPETSADQFPLMLRALLAERFQLALHHESREISYLALEIGKKGPKLTPAQEEPDTSANRNGLGQIRSSHMAMPLLATLLSRFLRETVIDMTGLKGFYEVNLEWRPEDLSKPLAETEAGASVFSAIQSQLGLRLESRKGPLDVIVVDGALKMPIAN